MLLPNAGRKIAYWFRGSEVYSLKINMDDWGYNMEPSDDVTV